jgi:hypothetical protein
MILLTAVAVLVTGVSSLAFMLEPPRTKSHGSTNLGVRHPAAALVDSVTPDVPQRTAPQAIDVQLNCTESRHEFDRSIAQVRLSGAPCATGKIHIVSSEIRNDANGFSATVFHPTDTSYTTDYITLSPGENRIRVFHQFNQGGHEERDYIIQRRQ